MLKTDYGCLRLMLNLLLTASQLKCVTPTLETKFSFELEDLDINLPASPTKITVTDGDSLVPESSKSDMLSSSSHSAESGYSSNLGGGGRLTAGPSSEELELSSHVTNIHITGNGDSQVSYQQEHTVQDKTVTQVFDSPPRRLDIRDDGNLSPSRSHASHSVVKLPGSHEHETCTDDASIPSITDCSDVDDAVFEENPLYSSTTSSSTNDQLRNVPTTNIDDVKNSHITTTSPKKIKDIVSELNRSISEESAHNPRSNHQTHPKQSPVKVAPKPAERNISGKRRVNQTVAAEDHDYADVVAPNLMVNNNGGQKGSAQDQSEYMYAEAYAETTGPIKPSLVQPGPSGYCYVDPDLARNPLQAAAQKILSESHQQNEQLTRSAGAKPKTPHHNVPPGGKKPPVKAPAKPPRKSKPSTNVLNTDYEDVEAPAEEGAYEPVTVQSINSRSMPKSASHDAGEDSHRLHPVAYRKHEGGSSGSSVEDVYALVEAKSHHHHVSEVNHLQC